MWKVFKNYRFRIIIMFFFLIAICEVKGQLALTNDKNFTACGGEGVYSITVTQASKGTYLKYKIDWGEGEAPVEYRTTQSTMNYDYRTVGSYSLKLYGETTPGVWSGPVEYTVSVENSDIKIILDGASKGVKCKGTEMVLKLKGLIENSPSTIYKINYGDSGEWIVFEGKNLVGQDELNLKHVYTKSSCEAGGSGYTVSLDINNACKTFSAPTYGPYLVADQLKLSMEVPPKKCTGFEIDLDQVTTVQPGACGSLEIKKSWKINGEEVRDGYLFFNEPGSFTIEAFATMAGLDCGNMAERKTIEIIRVVKAVATPAISNICERKTVELKGSASEGDEKKYRWEVISGGSENVIFTPSAIVADPVATFNAYGTYRLRLTVFNDCSSDDIEVLVVVKKDPEVVRFDPLPTQCPEVILDLSGKIAYRMNGNTTLPTWSITPLTGWSWVGGVGTNLSTPRIKFTVPGDYTLTVNVEGVGCGATNAQLQKSQTIKIYDPTITPDITVSGNKTAVCEKEQIDFVNRSTGGQTLKYLWSVQKNGAGAILNTDYSYASGSAESVEPQIKFLTYGDYVVTVQLTLQCNSATRTFNIHVKKEPEITRFDALTAMCPAIGGTGGVLDLVGKIDYLWYNNTKNPTWTISGQQNIDWQYIGGANANSLYPQIRFLKPGNYTLTAELTSVGCGGTSLKKSQVITIYDAGITKDITIKDHRTEICENVQIQMENNTMATQPIYYWTVDRAGGGVPSDYVISAPAAAAPTIKFNRYGTYTVKVTITAQCGTDFQEFVVKVKKDPEIKSFEALQPICNQDVLNLYGKIEYEWYNNTDKKYHWEIIGEGGTFLQTSGPDAEYPQMKFTRPGTYTLKVTLTGVNCGGSGLTAQQTLVVLDPTVDKDIKIVGGTTTICENEDIVFKNNTQSVIDVKYLWTVSSKNDTEVDKGYRFIGNVTDSAPSIHFTRYGVYTVKVNLSTDCNSNDPQFFTINVQRDPEVYLKDLASICPKDELVLDHTWVTYKWNDNIRQEVLWTVKDADGKPSTDVVFNATDLYPRMKFTRPGNYNIEVMLMQPVGCDVTALSASKTIMIHNPQMALDVTVDRTVVCVGDEVFFDNQSTAAETPVYTWTVSPSSGWDGFDRTQKSPRITFRDYGIYTVHLEMKGSCETLEKDIAIVVRKDPSVVLNDFPPMCPGELDLTADYTWRDNAEKVTWTITPSEGFETVSGGLTALKPRFRFNVPGDYEIVVALESNGCVDSHLSDTTIFTIFKPDIDINVNVAGQVCENETIRVENQSLGHNLKYKWTMAEGQSDGWHFEQPSKETDKTPEIRFTKYGKYKLRLDIDGECSDSVRFFEVIVKGIPVYTFKSFDNICAGSSLKMDEFLTVDTRDATITPRWTITPSGNGEYEYVGAEDENSLFPEIRFLKNGIYTLQLVAESEYGGPQTFKPEIRVLSTVLEAKTLTDFSGCTDLEVLLTNNSVGDSLHYEWNITPATGWHFKTLSVDHATAFAPSVVITERNDYQIRLAIGNICGEHSTEFKIHAYSAPEIDPIADIKEVCERGYVFEGNKLVNIKENGDAVQSVKWTIFPAGYHFVAPGDEQTQQPDITFDGSETPYQLKLEIKNGCPVTVEETFTALVDKFEPIVPLRDTAVCARSGPALLTAQPLGGVWTTDAVGMIEHQPGEAYYFNPHKDEDAVFEVIYSRGVKSCMAHDTMALTVHKLPVVDAGEDLRMCINHDPMLLPDQSPSGGFWKGIGVLSGHFKPEITGVKDTKLEYWYTDPVTRCDNVDSVVMTVDPLPNPAFTFSSQHCRGIDSLFTPVQSGVGNTYNWTFGDGSTEISQGPVAHRYEPHGIYNVSVVCTSVHGCVDAYGPKEVDVVNQPPTAVFTVNDTMGCAPLAVQFTVDLTKYSDTHLRFVWDFGNGQENNTLQPSPNPVVFPPPLYDTTYIVQFKVYNICDTKMTHQNIHVRSLPVAKFTIAPDEQGCDPFIASFVNMSTGSGNSYSWTFGDGATSDEKSPDHTFRSGRKVTNFPIELLAQNQCTATVAKDTVMVKPNDLNVVFKADKRFACVGDTIRFTNYSVDTTAHSVLNQFWNFGDGQVSLAWDTSHVYRTDGKMGVNLTVSNGCAKREYQDTITVYPIPLLTIESKNQLCEDDTLPFVLTSTQPLKQIRWNFGDGSVESGFKTSNRYETAGFYTTQVKVLSAEIPSCPADKEKIIEVWPKPDLQILPLDTVVCSPYLYRPKIIGEGYLKWDFGTGEALTSDDEHLYVNDTNYIREYDIRVYAESNRGCRQEYSGHVRQNNSPKGKIDKKISYGRPEQVEFINLSRDYSECIWYLPGGQVVKSPDNQTVIFEEDALYPLALVVINEYGCRDSVNFDHKSYMSGLYFPNTFIPHSKNPKISHFRGIGMGLKEYHLEIMDGYGNKVWETRALSFGEPSEGWDGTNAKGELLPQGVYTWRAKAVFFSEDIWTGENNGSGNPQTTQGTVLMLRK